LIIIFRTNFLKYIGQKSEHEPQQSNESKGKKNKEDVWANYDELLINAVLKWRCLWNHSIPAKERSSLKVNDAWNAVKTELKDIFK